MRNGTIIPNEINKIAESRKVTFAPYFIAIGGFILGVPIATGLVGYLGRDPAGVVVTASSFVTGVLGLSFILDGFANLKRREDSRG